MSISVKLSDQLISSARQYGCSGVDHLPPGFFWFSFRSVAAGVGLAGMSGAIKKHWAPKPPKGEPFLSIGALINQMRS